MRPAGSTRSEMSGGPILRLHANRGDFASLEGWRFNLVEWLGDSRKIAIFQMLDLDSDAYIAPGEAGFSLTDHGVQTLFDELWGMGFRPTRRRDDQTGVVDSMESHIQDLRKIAFNRLKIES